MTLNLPLTKKPRHVIQGAAFYFIRDIKSRNGLCEFKFFGATPSFYMLG